MKYFIVCFIALMLLCSAGAFAKKKEKEYKGPPRTEGELIGKIIDCLRFKDTITYPSLFPDFDTVWKQIIEYRPRDEMEAKAIAQIRQHPEKVKQFDPYYNHAINKNAYYVMQKGEDSGIHWNQVLMMRYELQKVKLTRDMVGYDLIAPTRFQGYVLLRDMLTRQVFIFTVNELQNIGKYWYGGVLANIYPAESIEEFQAKEAGELRIRRMMKEFGLTEADLAKIKSKDTSKHVIQVNENDDDDANTTTASGLIRRDVVDRKLYTGTFDNQIQVKLYVRYMKGNCPGGVCSWEAIYKFGDQDEFIKLDVSKTKEGNWLFNEDPPIGSMELTLKDKVFTGTWASSDIKTGYDVKLKEAILSTSMMKQLDHIIEHGDWAKGLKEDKEEDKNPRGINEDITKGVY